MNHFLHRQLTASVLTLSTFAPFSAHALQMIDAQDGVTVEATIATKEPTRIRIESTPITDVFGNLYSSNCTPPATTIAGAPVSASPAVNPSGEIALECDREKGEIYVRPIGTSGKPINLFVSSANATYTLLLKRSDTPSDTIVIRDKSARRSTDSQLSARQGPLGGLPNPIRSIKAMLVAMTSGQTTPDIHVEEVNRPIHLWKEARLLLTRTYEARGLIGEKYLLTNISTQAMGLSEQEFDRPQGNVVGVAIDNLNLRPGEATVVYVIRQEN